jgi:K+-sensing histidine kinase KdpD
MGVVTSVMRNGSRATGVDQEDQATRGKALRYGTAAVLACASVAAVAALLPLTERATFTPMIGVVAVVVWYGGLGPGLLTIAIGWVGALFLLTEPRYSFTPSDRDEATRWAVSLAVALGITWVAWILRRGRA